VLAPPIPEPDTQNEDLASPDRLKNQFCCVVCMVCCEESMHAMFFFSPTGWELLITTFLITEHAYHTTPTQLHTYIHKMHTDDENKNSSISRYCEESFIQNSQPVGEKKEKNLCDARQQQTVRDLLRWLAPSGPRRWRVARQTLSMFT
jgi:hypothetical protein